MCEPSREMCSYCGRISAISFHVPTTIWKQVMGDSQDILCLGCFTLMADRAYVKWDEDIKFYPVSKVTHRENTYSAYETISKLEKEIKELRT